MPIEPITSTRFKTFVILGHSNADGWAPMDGVVATPSDHLYPGTRDWDASPENAIYKGIYMATSAQPWPGSFGTPVASSIGDVEWLEMTVASALSPSAPHPHASPFNYPNVAGACYPRWGYNAFPYGSFTYDGGGSPTGPWLDRNEDAQGVRTGIEVPLGWHLRNFFQEQVGFVKIAFSSSFFLPIEAGPPAGAWLDTAIFPLGRRPSEWTPSSSRPVQSAVNSEEGGFNGYWTPTDKFDFAPGTNRFYQQWLDKMAGAASALPAGSLLDVRGVLAWFGDNDSVARMSEVLIRDWKRSVTQFVKQARNDIAANDWSSIDKHQIPIFWPKVHFGYPNAHSPADFDSVSYMNGVLDEVAAQDEFFRVLDSHSWSTLLEEGFDLYGPILTANNHYGPAGYRQAADDVTLALEQLETDPFDALDIDDTLTLKQTRDRARTYYSKSRSSSDMTDEIVNQHINAAMYHCLNHCGDNAWWLRRRQPLAITSGANAITTLPRYVDRLLMIEDSSDASYPLDFDQVGHGNQGRLQIQLSERASGTYWCHFITMPGELTKDDQMVPAPRNIAEWIIVEACRRMAASSNNAPLMGHFAGESMQLQVDSLRSMGQVQRSKKDVMRTQRRRPNFRYGRGFGRHTWGSDY